MGLGEAPLVRQCTISVWDDTASMVAYAHDACTMHVFQISNSAIEAAGTLSPGIAAITLLIL
jgi:hypothetical protein